MKLRILLIKISKFCQSRLAALNLIKEKQGFSGNYWRMVIECKLLAYFLRSKGGIKKSPDFLVFVEVYLDKVFKLLP